MINYKNWFKYNPIDTLEIIDNERYLYKEILEIKENIKRIEKRKYNQIYGMTARKQNDYISKVKIQELIKDHKKFLSKEFSKYSEDDIENRKAIQYASARLSFLLEDIYKIGE